MSKIRIKGIRIENYRSFKDEITIRFPDEEYKKPVAIVGYNNSGKTNLMNALLYGITEKYVTKDTFTINDFHNRSISNVPQIMVGVESSEEDRIDGKIADLSGYHNLEMQLDGTEIVAAKIGSYKDFELSTPSYKHYGASKYYKIFYVNFHEVKKEISTKKTSWGNLTSFLAKHIKSLVDNDDLMLSQKTKFKENVKTITEAIMKDSSLDQFISRIQENYTENLRSNNCVVDFGLPDYEDIFLEMLFKVGLNGDKDNLIPIDHFGDGYISMFVMAVIKAIAESNTDDRCLFLFEEPESFLHENHQEYFYNTVLCSLSQSGHQVIYTTHSDRMIDIFDTKGLIRLEFDDTTKQTVLKYNNCDNDFAPNSDVSFHTELLSEIDDHNNYIKIIEPNLNRLIFSQKVLLVEGPNDVMVYKTIVKKAIESECKDKKYAENYLTFNNIAIIPHHGKITAIVLIELCKHLGIEYFVVNDLDFAENFVTELDFVTEDELKASELYKSNVDSYSSINSKGIERSPAVKRSMITTNWRLINAAGLDRIHFNVPKLEAVIDYDSDDKSSIGIWKRISEIKEFKEDLLPESLLRFLGIE